jgi:PAS domain S-box-containing protein
MNQLRSNSGAPTASPLAPHSHFTRTMTAAYLTALIVLGAASLVSYFVLQRNIAGHTTHAAVAGVTERQRTLSQRTALFALSLVSTEDARLRDEFREELRNLISLMQRSHDALTAGDSDMGLPSTLSEKTRSMYFSPPMSLDSRIRTFISSANLLVETPDDQLNIAHPSLKEITSLSTRLLTDLEQVVEQHRLESEQAVRDLQRLETLALAASLLCLLLTALFVFQPLVRRIKRDLQSRGIAEHRLISSEERYRMVTEAVSDAIFALNDLQTIEFANPAAARIFKAPSREALNGVPFLTLLSDESREPFHTFISQRGPSHDGVGVVELTGRCLDGSTVYLELLAESRGEGRSGAPTIVTVRDVSQRQLAQRRELHYLERLQRSNRELEQFAYIISHDLKAPLHQVSSFAQLLARRYKEKLGDDAHEFIQFIVDGTTRMKHLINDLLELSRVTTRRDPFQTTDLGQCVRDVLKDLAGRVEETGAKVEVGELPTIDADPTQIRSLVQNLVENSLKFHRPGVPPVVKISSNFVYRPAMGDFEGGPEEHIEIVVEDNGIGFDQSREGEIYKIFQRLHPRETFDGTGIGLALCKRIVERHRGTLRAESEPGKGTKMFVTIPTHQLSGDENTAESGEPAPSAVHV